VFDFADLRQHLLEFLYFLYGICLCLDFTNLDLHLATVPTGEPPTESGDNCRSEYLGVGEKFAGSPTNGFDRIHRKVTRLDFNSFVLEGYKYLAYAGLMLLAELRAVFGDRLRTNFISSGKDI